jgi:ketosteroid isomerase-like protein
MSQENVEIVRASFEAWNAHDMAAYRELYDPDAVLRMPEGWPEPGPYYGREAAMRQFEQLNDAWETHDAEPIGDYIDAADRIVVRFIWHGLSRGPEANLDLTTVFTVRKGKILGLEFFWDYAEALEVLGLGVGDVAGERGDRQGRMRRIQPRGLGCHVQRRGSERRVGLLAGGRSLARRLRT